MKETKFRYFTEEIFYGASNRDGNGPTEQNMSELQRQIDEVQSINSGLQQGCHCSHVSENEACAQQTHDMMKLKEALGKSIMAALGLIPTVQFSCVGSPTGRRHSPQKRRSVDSNSTRRTNL